MKNKLWIIFDGIQLTLGIYEGYKGSWYYVDSGSLNFNSNMDELLDSHFVSVCGMTAKQYVNSKDISIVDSYECSGCPIISKHTIELLGELMVEDGIAFDRDGIERKMLGISK